MSDPRFVQIQKFLKGVRYRATKDAQADHQKKMGTGENTAHRFERFA